MSTQIMNPNQIFSRTFLHNLSYLPYPTLDIKERKGFTGYIDFIDSDEFSGSVTRGIDCYNRPFICLKVKCTLDDGSIIPSYQTFFQRYSDDYCLWMGTSNSLCLLNTIRGMTNFQKELICDLILKKSVDIIEDKYDYYNFSYESAQYWENKIPHKKIIKLELDDNLDLTQDTRLVCVGYDGDKA
jgi:hypothetical protein